VLAVFAVFIVATFSEVDRSLGERGADVLRVPGFSVITFSARGSGRPRPRAADRHLAGSLYILISLAVFAALTVGEVVDHGETAIAAAARPTLGDAGFTMMAIAAILATMSSVNATVYASSGLTKDARRCRAVPAAVRPRDPRRRARRAADP